MSSSPDPIQPEDFIRFVDKFIDEKQWKEKPEDIATVLFTCMSFDETGCLEKLLPVLDSEEEFKNIDLYNQLMLVALNQKAMNSVRLLLPLVNPNFNQSIFVYASVENNLEEALDCFLDICDMSGSDRGCDINLTFSKACAKGYLSMAKKLLPHADPNYQGGHCLWGALVNNHPETALWLLDYCDVNAFIESKSLFEDDRFKEEATLFKSLQSQHQKSKLEEQTVPVSKHKSSLRC